MIQALRILPFTPLWPRQDSPGMHASGAEKSAILVSNILMKNRASEASGSRSRTRPRSWRCKERGGCAPVSRHPKPPPSLGKAIALAANNDWCYPSDSRSPGARLRRLRRRR